MLSEIRIVDFAIIDNLSLTFADGLVTFTGETGAGKSIIFDAVEAIMGGRVDSTMIRTGAERAQIEAEFRISATVRDAIHAILEREDMLDDPDYLIMGREIRRNGRNVARVNGRSVTVSLLKELGEYLVDLHGQSEHLSLLRVREHLRLLDSFAGVGRPLTAYMETYKHLRRVRNELADLRASERDAARRADLLSYQINEIDEAMLKAGEEDTLKQERDRLANAESLANLTQETLFLLDESEPESQAAIDLIGQAVENLQQLVKMDKSMEILAGQIQGIFEGIADLALELRDYSEQIEYNPERLEEVEDRLDLILSLKRKYGNSIEEILAFVEDARQRLDNITNAEKRLGELVEEEQKLLEKLATEGETLHQARLKAADDMSKAIEEQLEDLKMQEAQFRVDFQRRDDPDGVLLPDGERVAFGPRGLETVQFLVAPNPGEGLKPLAKIASGGEMSRLMLALKNVLAEADTTSTLIFDEIDQGIGGRIGAVVGEKLWRLSRSHQVLCITHLPQLAAFGKQHYRVLKHVVEGRTSTIVESLAGEPRVMELAQMLGDVSEGTIRSAHEMLQGVSAVTK